MTKANSVLTLSGGSFDVTGQITGGTGSDFNSDLVVNNGAAVTLDNSNNNYTGPTSVYGGSTLKNGINNALPTGTVLTLGDTSDGAVTNTYDLNGHNQGIAALNSISHGGNSNFVTNNGGASGTLTLTGLNSDNSPASSNFNGIIEDGSAVTTLAITGGTHTLSGANTYSGGTTVGGNATLLVDNTSGSGTGTGNLTVANGSTLGGNGTVTPTGANAVSISGTLSPGDVGSIGKLTIDSSSSIAAHILTFTAGATLDFDLGPGFTSDTLTILNGSANDVVFNNNVISFNAPANLPFGTYVLFTANSSSVYGGLTLGGDNVIDRGLILGTSFPGTNAYLILSGNNIDLSLATAAPGAVQPGSLLGMGVLALLVRCRIRRKALKDRVP